MVSRLVFWMAGLMEHLPFMAEHSNDYIIKKKKNREAL